MDTKRIHIQDIKPASYNPRKLTEETRKSLENSIETFGLVDPIIINLKTRNIIGGHQRFDYLYSKDDEQELILIERGDIGWVFTDEDLQIKDDEHEKALNIALNKISGEWDINSLNKLLDELKTFELDGLTGFDYSLDDFEYEYILLEDDDEDYTSDDEVGETVQETTTKDTINEEPVTIKTKETTTTQHTHLKIQENTIYKNNNNIIYYGNNTKENKKELLKQAITTKEYPELELVETINTPYHYYITNSEEQIRQILQDPNTERIR